MSVQKCLLRSCISFLMLAALAPGQEASSADREIRLPNGKLQRDEIIKSEHQKSLKDAAELLKLGEELKAELEKSDGQVLSVQAIKMTDEIEKIARRIRSRIKRN